MIPTALIPHQTDILEHLLLDKLIKFGIVIAAVLVILIGLVIIWRRGDPRRR